MGTSVLPRRAQQNIGNVLAVYSHSPFALWPPEPLGAACSGLSHGFASPRHAVLLVLPTLGLSAPCMHLCRPELYLETPVYLEPVVNQGVYSRSFLASCSSVVLQKLS